ncbi:MAG: GntR family transcriptional regulator [Blautia sp.]|nr:GntR family transcriptional regulator [Blautia sp.]
MNLIINTSSMIPIYEQIMEAIKKQIVSGELTSGDPLPSVRTLSKELKISALTVKKAYDRLEEEGFTATIHGKGTYVTGANREMLAEQQRKEIEKDLETAVQKARGYGIPDEEVRELLELILTD